MEDDLIVVDDYENEAGPSTSNHNHSIDSQSFYASSRPKTVAERNIGPSRLRSSSHVSSTENTEPKTQTQVERQGSIAGAWHVVLGQYDRELDSDDEDLAFEEQFILRMPPGEDCEKLRKAIASREVGNDVWFKFKDSRRAVFHIGNNMYSAKLVDLPCVMESQKTLDNKQMFKVADICQMLVVDKKIPSEDQFTKEKGFNIDEFIWPHGITPPLHHVRKRRFRKRVNRRTIESVEQEVERLLDEDELASEVKYDILENVNPDLSDSELIEQDAPLDAPTPAVSDLGDAYTPGDIGEGDEDDESVENEEEEGEGDIDEELAAELDLALENEEGEEGDGDDEDEDDESEEEDSEDEDDEDTQAKKLLSEEIRDLEAAVAKKRNEIASSANPLIRKRFEDALKKLTADLEMKTSQRDELKERQRMKKEGITMDTVEDTDPDNVGNDDDDGDGGDDEGDLFGDDSGMDIG
ncbi:TAFII55 protein conserved region-domain-containing protein [Flammula alnicola]|nr:TAFII55 protein conserved region-domain-containing protein [Flammula alnicola]